MSSPPWMPLYVADYLADTGHLGALEHGAYLLLIMHYWRHGSVPRDDGSLAKIARVTKREWSRIRANVSAFFDADWRHARIDAELAKAHEKSQLRAEAGSRGGTAKARNEASKRVAKATNLPQQNSTDALASSSDVTFIDPSLRSGSEPRKRASRLPENWILPDKFRQWALDRGYSLDVINREAERMARWSRSSRAGAKLDWFATWQNWIDDKPKRAPARAGPQRETLADVLGELRERANAEKSGDNDPVGFRGPAAGEPGTDPFALDLSQPARGEPGRSCFDCIEPRAYAVR